MPPPVESTARRYLDAVDRALPGRIAGFYLVGSVALGAFRSGRSDIDFVAVVGSDLTPAELARLRGVHRRHYASRLAAALVPPRWPLVCNGVFVRPSDLGRSSLSVQPIASQVAGRFEPGVAFDVNPVTWWTLAERGISVRGPAARDLGVPRDDAELRAWTRRNLGEYWGRWANAVRRPTWRARRWSVRHLWVWGVLGAPRLHHTIGTGGVISKEQAGDYALETFDARWNRLIRDALGYWRDPTGSGAFGWSPRRRAEAGEFVATVVESGLRL